jgi:hypothetical protein
MRVGDVVIQRDGPWSSKAPLVCGSGMYTHAICVSVEPFVLVSEEGDMMWSCLKPDQYVGLCEASTSARRLAFDRFNRRGRWAPSPSPTTGDGNG